MLGLWAFADLVGHFPAVRIDVSVPAQVLAGLLVWFGTRLGSSYTSRHVVSGLVGQALRSVTVVGVFMVTAATVFLVRYILG